MNIHNNEAGRRVSSQWLLLFSSHARPAAVIMWLAYLFPNATLIPTTNWAEFLFGPCSVCTVALTYRGRYEASSRYRRRPRPTSTHYRTPPEPRGRRWYVRPTLGHVEFASLITNYSALIVRAHWEGRAFGAAFSRHGPVGRPGLARPAPVQSRDGNCSGAGVRDEAGHLDWITTIIVPRDIVYQAQSESD